MPSFVGHRAAMIASMVVGGRPVRVGHRFATKTQFIKIWFFVYKYEKKREITCLLYSLLFSVLLFLLILEF